MAHAPDEGLANGLLPATASKKPFFTPMRLLLWGVILVLSIFAYRLYTGSSIAGAVRGPQVLFNEKVGLNEGEAKGYCFTVPSRVKVEVAVAAAPKPVNVMLMSGSQWDRYTKVQGSLFGGDYEYLQALSKQSVLQMKEADVLGQGRYCIAVERPRQALFFQDSTSAQVTITGY